MVGVNRNPTRRFRRLSSADQKQGGHSWMVEVPEKPLVCRSIARLSNVHIKIQQYILPYLIIYTRTNLIRLQMKLRPVKTIMQFSNSSFRHAHTGVAHTCLPNYSHDIQNNRHLFQLAVSSPKNNLALSKENKHLSSNV